MSRTPGQFFRRLPELPGLPKTAFALCLILVFFALGWTSSTTLEMETSLSNGRKNAASAHAATRAVSLADAAIFLWIESENRRPLADYATLHSSARPRNAFFDSPRPDEDLAVSPLFAAPRPPVRFYFQVSPSGEITSPCAPPLEWLTAAGLPPANEASANALAALRAAHSGPAFHSAFFASAAGNMRRLVELGFDAEPLPQKRDENAETAAGNETAALRFTGGLSPFFPVWMDGELYLLRRAGTTQGDVIQGILVDWPALAAALATHVAEVFPSAVFIPVPTPVSAKSLNAGNSFPLVAMPISLEIDLLPVLPGADSSRLRLMLYACWALAALAMLGLAVLFVAALGLSERRATFVSAVAHELRTPLTTFQLYTEMLAEDMAPLESRQSYLATLRSEAIRLSHLVENVLGFARLERGRALRRDETLPPAEIVARVVPRIRDRLQDAGISFTHEVAPAAAGILLRTDGTAVEQILFNLADNAAKYAVVSESHARLNVSADADSVSFVFSDNGPGIDASALRKLFRPFHRSSEDAAGQKPGVGLGLAFSRQLARSLGGDLELLHSGADGCVFRLSLPRTGSGS